LADHLVESQCLVIIESLQRSDLSHEERRKLIVEVEVLPFRGKEAEALAYVRDCTPELFAGGETIAVHVPVGNRLQPKAILAIAHSKNARWRQTSESLGIASLAHRYAALLNYLGGVTTYPSNLYSYLGV
jgi:hypothetical protein